VESAAELVSCLCVTRGRPALLRRAVACFQAQTHPHRELLIVWESDDRLTRDYLSTLDDPRRRTLQAPALPKRSLGALRNLAVAEARGTLVAQWDDDDWYAPGRLEEQLRALQESGRPACVLARWTIYDVVTQQAYLSANRAWEGSLVAEKAVVPAYADQPRGEDTVVIGRLLDEERITGLDRPGLYIYTYHGANTWTRAHFRKRILKDAEALSREESLRIAGLLRA
jgi:glycosyltransferase involved in cell wall biosynthesis